MKLFIKRVIAGLMCMGAVIVTVAVALVVRNAIGALATSTALPAAPVRPAIVWPTALPTDPIQAAQVRSVIAALETGAHPERLTPAVAPSPFDAEAFARDPVAYLSVCEPARCYHTLAEVHPGARTLVAQDAADIRLPVLGSVPLTVLGEPLAPVTFTTLDGGAFDNGLSSITVRADAAGVATVRYTATAGVTAGVRIAAGSPLCDGVVNFFLTVSDPITAAR